MGNGWEKHLWSSVVTDRNPPPALESAEHDLGMIAPLVSALFVFDRRLELLPVWDAGSYPIVLQRFSKPVGITVTALEQPFDVRQAAEQRPCANVLLTDLAVGDEQPDRFS